MKTFRQCIDEGLLGTILGTAIGVTTAAGVATDYFAMRAQRKAERQAADTAVANHVRQKKAADAVKRKAVRAKQPRKPRKPKI